MDNKDRKKGEEKSEVESEKNRVEIKKIKVIIVVIIIAAIIYVAKEGGIEFAKYELEKRKFESEQQLKEIEQQEKEEKKSPQMKMNIGGSVKCGDKKYQVIHISNNNAEVAIKSGTLVVEYRISGQNKDININCYLDGAIYDEKVEYLEELDRGIFLLRKDHRKFTKMIESCLADQGINVAEGMVYQPYLFIYYKYTCEKENLEGYYKINIEEHGFGAVEKIDEPEKYFYVYEIEI